MFNSHALRRLAVPALLTAGLAVGATVLIGSHPDAQAQQQQAAEPAMKVGVYDPQSLFEQYPGSGELIQFFEGIQQQMQAAQQSGDQQKLQELQQAAEQKQNEVLENFHDAVDRALPDVADEANVKVVALEIVYTADDVQTTNLTQPLAVAITQE